MLSAAELEDLLLLAHHDEIITDEELVLLLLVLWEDDYEPMFWKKYPRFTIEQFDNMTDNDSVMNFRFSKADFTKLHNLLDLPEKLTSDSGTTWGSMEGFAIVLRRLAYPNRLYDLCNLFGRAPSELSVIFNTTCHAIHERWAHLLDDFEKDWLDEQVAQTYAIATSELSPLDHCIGYVDGTIRRVCRPIRKQRELYNGHKRVHCLKYQGTILPSGILTHVYGPFEGRRHDAALMRESGLQEQLQDLDLRAQDGVKLHLYGDTAYGLSEQIIVPFQGAQAQREFNKGMSSARESIEWGFGKISSLWKFVDYSKNQKVLLQPVGVYYRVAALLTNCHTCCYSSQTGMYFDIEPPTLEQYLS